MTWGVVLRVVVVVALKLLIVGAGLYLAPIAPLTEGEVEVVAVVAYPVALSLPSGGSGVAVGVLFEGSLVLTHGILLNHFQISY